MKNFTLILTMIAGIFLSACEKMLDFQRDPEDAVLLTDAIQTPEDLQKLLISCYDVTANAQYGRQQNLAELLSDNLAAPNSNDDYNEVYIRNTIFFNGTIGNYYNEPYIAIYRANILLENFDLIEGLTDEDRVRIEAEARFIRALNHFEVVNLFAQPYVPNESNDQLGIVLKETSSFDPVPRSTVNTVYQSVISDLKFARDNLPTDNGVFANKYAAYAMLARVYFQMNDFQEAADHAAFLIQNGGFSIGSEIDRWMNEGASENIFTLIIQEADGRDNSFGSYRSDNVDIPTLVASVNYYDTLFVNGPLANPSDIRKDWFEFRQFGTADPFYAVSKFNADFFSIPYLHLTEVLLIHAESLAELGTDLGSAVDDINLIRVRGGIAPVNASISPDDIIDFARHERKKEMIGEGRWVMDLKRRGAKGDLQKIRGVDYDCKGMVLQFPISENTQLFEMNPTGGCN